jgi:uncharacterized protein with NAD-binding domain and iron-sulfur cluster
MTGEGKKERIAILGGGVAGLATAFALTSQPGWQARYEITIYEQGHRLGGKCASVRNPEKDNRVEEHGPHLWFGFYFSSFAMLSEAFRYCREHHLAPECPFQDWPDVFEKQNGVTLMEYIGGEWRPWAIELPEMAGTPVEPKEGDVWQWLLDLVGRIVEYLNDIRPSARRQLDGHKIWFWAYRAYCSIAKTATPAMGGGHSLLDAARHLLEHIVNATGHASLLRRAARWLARVLLGSYLRNLLRDLQPLLATEDDLRHAWYVADLLVAGLRGLIGADVFTHGLDAIEDVDFSRWLEKNGAADPWSPLVRAMYDTQAEYTTGKTAPPDRPDLRPDDADLAAGTAIHCFVRMFAGYHGAFTYKTKAGMGECIVTPIYLALRDRGVKFAFFHRVKNLRLASGERRIQRVELDIQADVAAGPYAYQPLTAPLHGLLCWPRDPFYDQLTDGAQIRAAKANLNSVWCDYRFATATLEAGTDFDQLVLAIPNAALPSLCGELSAADAKWKRMLDGLATVQTQFWTVWMKRTTSQLSPQSGQPITECAAEPIDSWLDMSQILAWEGWSAGAAPASAHYFEGPLDQPAPIPPPFTDCDFQAREDERVRQNALRFFRQNALALWTKAGRPDSPKDFDWNLMASRGDAAGEDRFLDQYWRANVDPSERFGLSTAGSKFCRLRPDRSGFENLYLAGDWTLNGLNAGAVEATMISALAAARGISGCPKEIPGGYKEMEGN